MKHARKESFREGQVIAYRRRGEILHRYGKIATFLGSIYDYQGNTRAGFSIQDGNNVFAVPVNAMRKLTRLECLGKNGKNSR